MTHTNEISMRGFQQSAWGKKITFAEHRRNSSFGRLIERMKAEGKWVEQEEPKRRKRKATVKDAEGYGGEHWRLYNRTRKRMHRLILPDGTERRLRIRNDLRDKVSDMITEVMLASAKHRKLYHKRKFSDARKLYKYIEVNTLWAYKKDPTIDLVKQFNADIEAYFDSFNVGALDEYFV